MWRVYRPRVRLVLWAFVLNAAWEVAHWPLYACPWRSRVLARAACVDAVLTLGAAEPAGLVSRRSHAGFWAALVGGLGVTAWAIERQALWPGRRFYSSSMPLVGDIGITPLAQLPLLGAAAAALAGYQTALARPGAHGGVGSVRRLDASRGLASNR